ncbi:MAG: VapC toxin family PIN domain ribonuclease [Opitutaceae bacterium]|nr:VapC toxin family PIN domain ribonuclease [Opitutaceae bacterium]
MKHLLDINVFIAAIYGGHAAHAPARAWLDKIKRQGWGIPVETYLGAMRLLMNPVVMGDNVHGAAQAMDAIDAELGGAHPGRIIFATQKPSRSLPGKAQGHKQVMDLWLIQIAQQERCKLATSDAGMLTGWPDDTVKV